MFIYTACLVTVVAIGSASCEPKDDVSTSADKHQANRRSFGEYHQYGLQYAPSYHSHYGPPATTTYHGHYAPAHHYHGHYAPAHHYHGHRLQGYAATPIYYHTHQNYAPGHYNGQYYNHETTVHSYNKHHPVVYQSVVNTYPTATTVVHKPVPVPVAQPIPVPVARPVAVEVPRPYPVPVARPYPVHVIKPVAVPVAQPYPVTVYRPYPVPVYRPVPVAVRPFVHHYAATRVPTAVRVPLTVRYPAAVQPSYLHHSHHAHYAPQYPTTVATPTTYLQQLAVLRAAAATATTGGEYVLNEAAVQQQSLQDEYGFLQEQPDVSVATDIHHHDDDVHHHDHIDHHHHDHIDHHHVHTAIDQDSGISGYPSLTTDETFKNSLGVPNTDYTVKKK